MAVDDAIGKLWLNSAKIARKAGHTQTAYSALLHAQRLQAPFSFVESAKLIRSSGEPMRALQELEKSINGRKSVTDRIKSESPVLEVTVNFTNAQREAKVSLV